MIKQDFPTHWLPYYVSKCITPVSFYYAWTRTRNGCKNRVARRCRGFKCSL